MTSIATDRPLSRGDLLDRAREVGGVAWSRREETDRARRLPDDIIEDLHASGLLKLTNQKRWGGAEADLMTVLDVGRELARGSGALGWIYTLSSFHTWYMAFTSEELQHEVYGTNQDALVADSFAPVGKIEPVSGGYLVSGEWRFTSGIEWASWVALGGLLPATVDAPAGPSMFFLPRSEITIRDDWFTLGLRGTASRTVVADRVFVPEHRVYSLGLLAGSAPRGPIAEQSPLWRVPLMTIQGMAVMTASIGIAQRMHEEFTATTRNRVRWLEPGAQQRESPAAQITIASTATQWDAVWALAQTYVREGWERGEAGNWTLSDEERAKYFSWRAYIARSCVEMCDDLFASSGAWALLDSSPLQQLFRDVHAAGVHVGTDRGDAFTSRGRVTMGLPGHPFH